MAWPERAEATEPVGRHSVIGEKPGRQERCDDPQACGDASLLKRLGSGM